MTIVQNIQIQAQVVPVQALYFSSLRQLMVLASDWPLVFRERHLKVLFMWITYCRTHLLTVVARLTVRSFIILRLYQQNLLPMKN